MFFIYLFDHITRTTKKVERIKNKNEKKIRIFVYNFHENEYIIMCQLTKPALLFIMILLFILTVLSDRVIAPPNPLLLLSFIITFII